MMKNYDNSVEMVFFNLNCQNLNWSYVSDHLYNILIIGRSGSGKTYALPNLIKYQRPDVDKTHLFVKIQLYQSNNSLLTEKKN